MILVAGHYCHDTLIGNAGERHALGGTAAYASAILTALGTPHRVLAKVGEDFRHAAEVAHAPRVVPGRTTAFVDDYRTGERRQRVEAVAPPIEPSELQGRYEIGIAGAIAGELPERTLVRMRQICGRVVADAQAVLREITPEGEVRLHPPSRASIEALDVLKASRHEAGLLDVEALRRRLVVVITDGARGSVVLDANSETRVPALEADEVDPTGAGDCFLAGFAAGLWHGLAAVQAARVGAYCGARAVEQVGVPRLTPDQARTALHASSEQR